MPEEIEQENIYQKLAKMRKRVEVLKRDKQAYGYATRCFEADVSPKVVQQQLGHATLKMTMDLYTHLLDEKKADELEKFNEISDEVFENGENLTQDRYKSSLHPAIINFLEEA